MVDIYPIFFFTNLRLNVEHSSDETFDKDVFAKYLNALRNLYVVEELPAWNPNLRSRTAIRTKETRHFIDPSIGAAALGITPEGIF